MKKLTTTLLTFLRSHAFFYVVVGLLVFQAAWLALTARYPMAFDENFHFGIIQLYAHQWSPFFTSAPANSAQYGDLVRNPSYLYQYLMSFPYRLIALCSHNETLQIILLRFINIGLFTGGLFIWRRLLQRLHISSAITHFSLLMLVLIPVVPFLAGQINYDNLVFLIVPLAMLLTLTCKQRFEATGSLPPIPLLLLGITGMLGGLVKYAFLPIFLGIVIYLLVVVLRSPHRTVVLRRSISAFWTLGRWTKIGIVVGFLVVLGLFVERYGVNIVKYHSVQPDCARIESVDQCLQYGPWARNYVIKANLQAASGTVELEPSGWLFVPAWAQGMIHRLYFAINYNYDNYNELPIPMTTAFLTGGIGLGLCLLAVRKLWYRGSLLYLPLTVIVCYVVSLLYVNVTDYLHFKTMLAINGRYLILILPLLFALIACGYSELFARLSRHHTEHLKLGFACLVTLLVLQGGGLITYIVRSDEGWYWPNTAVIETNKTAKQLLTPLIIGADKREGSGI